MATVVLSNEERRWLRREEETWRLIRTCFAEYLLGKPVTPQKLHALCMLTWITTGGDNTKKATLPALRTLSGKTNLDGVGRGGPGGKLSPENLLTVRFNRKRYF